MADDVGRMNDELFVLIGSKLDQDWKEASSCFVGETLPLVASLTKMCSDYGSTADFVDLISNSPQHLHFARQFCGLALREAEYRRQVAMRDAE